MKKKPIRLSEHAREQLLYRGASEKEIVDAIQTGLWGKSKLGRLESQKNFPCNKRWNNKSYETKQVRPIFVEEEKEIVVVTVYVYYF